MTRVVVGSFARDPPLVTSLHVTPVRTTAPHRDLIYLPTKKCPRFSSKLRVRRSAMADEDETNPPPFEATLRYKTERYPLNLIPSNTVSELKELAVELIDEIESVEDLRLVVGGHVLGEPEATMEQIGLKEGSIVHAAKAAKASAAQSQPVTAAALLHEANRPKDPVGLPAGMGQMMQSPMIRGLMSNPELLRRILTADPRFREAMEREPRLRELLNDPSSLRQMMEMASNPAALKEAQRHQDRALLNIENIPGGFSALSSMHKSLSALHGPSESNPSTDELNRRFAERLGVSGTAADPSVGPNASALPNPWAAPKQSASSQNPLGGLADLRNMGAGNSAGSLGGLSLPQFSAAGTGSSATSVPPEERFRNQLETLSNMGFPDTQRNIRALVRPSTQGNNIRVLLTIFQNQTLTGGNVDAAIDLLLGQMA